MKKGSCECLIIPFDLGNASNTFMSSMNDVLCWFQDSFVIVYLGGSCDTHEGSVRDTYETLVVTKHKIVWVC